MAKQSVVSRNEKRLRMSKQQKNKRHALKMKARDLKVPLEERFNATLKLAKMPRNGSQVRVRNRCGLTGRGRGYHRKLGVSRIMLRELASQGLVPGMVKSSW